MMFAITLPMKHASRLPPADPLGQELGQSRHQVARLEDEMNRMAEAAFGLMGGG